MTSPRDDVTVGTGRAHPTFVLVHGAWHGSWTWAALKPQLEDLGYDVFTVDLPGIGRAPGRHDLPGHADALSDALAGLTGDVVVCGHSYGGAVLSEAVIPGNVRGLIYLAAFQLAIGQSCREANPPATARSGPDPVSLSGDYLEYDPLSARADFYADCPDDAAQAAAAKLTPEHVATVTATQTRAAWMSAPSAYIVCTHDRALPEKAQRLMAARSDSSVSLPSSHAPMLSMPGRLAATMSELAAGF